MPWTDEARYRDILEAMDDAVYICSQDFRVEYMNPKMIKRIGKDAVGHPCYEALHGLKENCKWCCHAEVMKGAHVKREVESPYDGATYLISNSPIENPDGSVSKLTIYRDISGFKDLERKLRQAQKMEALGALAGGIAHDFNNILFPITGYAEILSENMDPTDPNKVYLEEVLRGAKRAGELVDQILAFSRQTEQQMAALKPDLIVKEVIKLVRATLPATIKIEKRIEAGCRMIMADPTQLHQVVMNLITNAYHAMQDTGGTLMVKLENIEKLPDKSLAAEGLKAPCVMLTVGDTGTGIDAAFIERIFDPYFTTKSKEKGTGLGLSVVHGIMKSFGGTIRVASIPGQGTTFMVYFPAIREDPSAEAGDEIREIGGDERLLVVDDEEQVLAVAKAILERLGYFVITEKNSRKALEALSENPGMVDLVITDMTMPDMTGDVLARELMAVNPDLPVIVCTGFSEKIDEEKAEELGIKGLLYKPVGKSDFARVIRRALG